MLCALGYLTLGERPGLVARRLPCRLYGLGFYMLHNTLQINATQMTPKARATAFALFSSAIYFGQTIGVGAARSCSTIRRRAAVRGVRASCCRLLVLVVCARAQAAAASSARARRARSRRAPAARPAPADCRRASS